MTTNESSREALWGKPNAFNQQAALVQALRAIAHLRASEPALPAGRLYFRELSGNGRDFGHSSGPGGVIAFSRILSDTEVAVVANCSTTTRFTGLVLQDPDLNRPPRTLTVAYSNISTQGGGTVQRIPAARFFAGGQLTGTGDATAQAVDLAPTEIQILTAT